MYRAFGPPVKHLLARLPEGALSDEDVEDRAEPPNDPDDRPDDLLERRHILAHDEVDPHQDHRNGMQDDRDQNLEEDFQLLFFPGVLSIANRGMSRRWPRWLSQSSSTLRRLWPRVVLYSSDGAARSMGASTASIVARMRRCACGMWRRRHRHSAWTSSEHCGAVPFIKSG